MVFCFLEGHAQLLQCDPIADNLPLASGLGSDNLLPGSCTILGEEHSLHSASGLSQKPALSGLRAHVMVEMISNILPVQFT